MNNATIYNSVLAGAAGALTQNRFIGTNTSGYISYAALIAQYTDALIPAGALNYSNGWLIQGITSGVLSNRFPTSDAQARNVATTIASLYNSLTNSIATQPINGSTVNYGGSVLLGLADANNYVRIASNAPCTATVQKDATLNLPVDTLFILSQTGSGPLTIVADAGVVINVPASQTLTLTEQWAQVCLRKVAANTWDLVGGLG